MSTFADFYHMELSSSYHAIKRVCLEHKLQMSDSEIMDRAVDMATTMCKERIVLDQLTKSGHMDQVHVEWGDSEDEQ